MKPGNVKCPDCGAEYKAGAPHQMFCSAKTCEECDTTFGEVIEPNEDGRRLCSDCQEALA